MSLRSLWRGRDLVIVPSTEPDLPHRQVDIDALLRELASLGGDGPQLPDPEDVRRLVAGKRVLVTGAGGSIGAELAVQISGADPAALTLLDRDESALLGVELRLDGHSLLDTPRSVLADIRDTVALEAVFAEHRPEIVLHAAALKHLSLLERFPREAWLTNVHGTANVLAAARRWGVTTFVNISTDKAADPTSVLGRSKQLGEAFTAHAAEQTGEAYTSVRFGNVIGSRGSVVHTFVAQAQRGGPLTVTDAEATRFLMSIPQACSLVLASASATPPGWSAVLDMGAPVRILDIADAVLAHLDVDLPIVYTGLRPGEKLHEQLFADEERSSVDRRGDVQELPVAPLDPESVPGPDVWDTAAQELLLALPDGIAAEAPASPSRAATERSGLALVASAERLGGAAVPAEATRNHRADAPSVVPTRAEA